MKLLIEHLKNFGCEYQITTSEGVVCSSDKYDKIKKTKMITDKLENVYSYDGNYYDLRTQMFEFDGINYTINIYVDITVYVKAVIKSKMDCLTRLPNRTHMEEFLSHVDKECVIVMCDIDDFKKVNDVHGHQVGDAAIRLVGDLIRNIIGESDFAGRYGGEEFLIVFDNSDVEQIKAKMDEFNLLLNSITDKLKLSSSIGIHCYKPTEESVNDAIRKADKALYTVKRNGKNASLIYNDSNK